MTDDTEIKPTFIQQGLEAIFKRPFHRETVNGEHIYFTDLPNNSGLNLGVGNLPQFLYQNHQALKELGTLGEAYIDNTFDVPLYWGIKESDLTNSDYLMDAASENKHAPRLERYKSNADEKMDEFFHRSNQGSKLRGSYLKKVITPQSYAQYMLSVLQGHMAAKKGWEDRDDNLVFQCEYLKLPKGGVENTTRLDLNLLSRAVQMHAALAPVPGLTPTLTILKNTTQPLNIAHSVTNNGPVKKIHYAIPHYKKNHVTAMYGVGYHIEGFDELDKLHDAIEQKLAQTPGGTLTSLTRLMWEGRGDKMDRRVVASAAPGFCMLDMDALRLPLKTDQFVDFQPSELLCKTPVSLITGMKKAIQLTTTNPTIRRL